MQKAYNITGEIMEIEELTVINCHEHPVSGMGHSFEEAFASLLDCLRLYTEAKGEAGNADAGRDSIIATPIADFSYSVNPRERKDVVAV